MPYQCDYFIKSIVDYERVKLRPKSSAAPGSQHRIRFRGSRVMEAPDFPKGHYERMSEGMNVWAADKTFLRPVLKGRSLLFSRSSRNARSHVVDRLWPPAIFA